MYTLEKAGKEDLPLCMELMEMGRAFQAEQGFVQWTDGYPGKDIIAADIAAGTGFLVKAGGKTAGYLCIDPAGEPVYGKIRGKWNTEEPYAVIHRMALHRDYRGQGLGSAVFLLALEYCRTIGIRSIRVDTGSANRRMQHLLLKNGFARCGTVFYPDGERLAYERPVPGTDI